MIKKWPESIQKSLLHILKEIEGEDQYTRQSMLTECKQHELYWHGFQHIFWDASVQDFRIPTQEVMDQAGSREEVKFIYDYVVNTFKAHGLSIIAALSAEVPAVAFSPMDADKTDDILAAEKAEFIGKVIQKYNKSKLLFYHALFTLYTNHFVASYNYYERDKKYGTVQVPKYKKSKVKTSDSYDCPECDFHSDQELVSCPECSGPLDHNKGQEEEISTEDGSEDVHRGMEKIKVKGTLNVKISTYAADQEACGYLIDYSDQHYAWLRCNYPNIDRNKLSTQGTDNFERIARMPSIGRLYSDTYLQSLLTLKRVWVRPWLYDMLDEDKSKELNKEFPDGVYFAVINDDVFAEAREEELDAHWTISKGDLSRAVHGDPLGKPLLPMQDLENMVTNLLVESLEHSVPSTFADPEILDFATYSKQEVLPGAIYPLKNGANPTKRIEDYFYTMKTSTLPKEGVDFNSIIETKGQFVVGAFPSIFGGPQTEGGKTLGEYQESRSYALQRLSIPYQLLFFWWADTLYKSVKDYIRNMITDEKHTTKTFDGKHASMQLLMEDFTKGEFSELLPESAIDLPISFSQKRSTLQQIIQLNSDYLNQFLFSPENKKSTLRFLGMEELCDLESNQTVKQLMEIDELLKSEPIQDEETGEEVSSLPIEIEIDDNEIHLRILKTFLSSRLGQENRKTNPNGYKNALLHAREHQQQIQVDAMQSMMNQTPPTPQSTQSSQSKSNTQPKLKTGALNDNSK